MDLPYEPHSLHMKTGHVLAVEVEGAMPACIQAQNGMALALIHKHVDDFNTVSTCTLETFSSQEERHACSLETFFSQEERHVCHNIALGVKQIFFCVERRSPFSS